MKKLIFVLILFVGLGAFITALRQVRVKEIRCLSGSSACSSEVSKTVEEFRDKSYFEARKTLSKKLSENKRLANFKINFNLPDVLVVEVVERTPEIAAKFGENSYFLFDKKGVSLGEVSETSLPIIIVYEVPAKEKFGFAVRLAREVLKYYMGRDIRLDRHGIYATVQNGVEVVLPLEGDIDVLLGSLEVTLSQLNEDGKNPTISLESGKTYKVDLRYKNPVISQI